MINFARFDNTPITLVFNDDLETILDLSDEAVDARVDCLLLNSPNLVDPHKRFISEQEIEPKFTPREMDRGFWVGVTNSIDLLVTSRK